MRALSLITALVLLVPLTALADDGATQITFEPVSCQHPAWSPDGSQIAFSSSSTALALVPATGGAVTLIPGTSEWDYVEYPTWSPDGSEIAFSVDDPETDEGRLLHAVPVAGGTARSVGLGCPGFGEWYECIEDTPCWSPDGTLIVLTKVTMPPMVDPSGGIKVIPAQGPGPSWSVCGDFCGRDPCWSPDMTHIAYRDPLWLAGDIWIIPAAGGAAWQLTTDPATDGDPAWSSDGRIAFCSNRTGNSEIWVIPATGGSATQVTADAASDSYPTWSPDGSQIAFMSNRSGNYDIWVIDAPGPIAVETESWASIKGKYRE